MEQTTEHAELPLDVFVIITYHKRLVHTELQRCQRSKLSKAGRLLKGVKPAKRKQQISPPTCVRVTQQRLDTDVTMYLSKRDAGLIKNTFRIRNI